MMSLLIFITCVFLPVQVRSYGKCDYQYTTEPSSFNGGCSPMNNSIKFQCKITINTASVGSSTCADYRIMWHFSTDSHSIVDVESEYTRDACSPSRQQLSITNNLTITALQPHHLGYYWCVTETINRDKDDNPIFSNALHSNMGHIRDISTCQYEQLVTKCREPVIELFQPTDGDSCASTVPPIQPTLNSMTSDVDCLESVTSEKVNTNSVSSSATLTEPLPALTEPLPTLTKPLPTLTKPPPISNVTSLEDDGESDTVMLYIFAIALLIMFVIITALLIVIAIFVCKKYTTPTGAVSDLSSTKCNNSNSIMPDPDMNVNNAYDSFSAVRYPVGADMTMEYEVMYGPVAMKDTDTTKGGNNLCPPMDSYHAEESNPQMHIYAHIGECHAAQT